MIITSWIILSLLCGSIVLLFLTRNLLYAVCSFICFIMTLSGYLLICQIEFIAINLVVIYVGVVSVIFLFLVFSLPPEKIKSTHLQIACFNNTPRVLFGSAIFKVVNMLTLGKLVIVGFTAGLFTDASKLCNFLIKFLDHPILKTSVFENRTLDIHIIGYDLYMENLSYLYLAACILFIVLISCVVLLKIQKK